MGNNPVGKAAETAVKGVGAGVQLGLNKDANRAVEKSAQQCKEKSVEAARDVAGFTTQVVAPAVQTAALATAHAAQLGLNKDTKEAMKDSAKQFEAGVAAHFGKEEPWFKGRPGSLGAWMKDIPDNLPITSLFLPGTHDSGANRGGDFAQCQSWTIGEQLNTGIRCFDIRLRMKGDAMCCHHGQIYMEINVGSIVKAMEDFLTSHPSEMLLARISDSGCEHHESHHNFDSLLETKFGDRKMWVSKEKWPLLGDVRGKCVFFQGRLDPCRELVIQDQWSVGDAKVKAQFVMDSAHGERKDKLLYVNYLNAQGKHGMSYTTPAGMATQVNKSLYDRIGSVKASVYMMDFPGQELVRRIIAKNPVAFQISDGDRFNYPPWGGACVAKWVDGQLLMHREGVKSFDGFCVWKTTSGADALLQGKKMTVLWDNKERVELRMESANSIWRQGNYHFTRIA